LAPRLEQIRIPFLARLQVSHGNRQIPTGRQAPDRESAPLIGTRALDEARARPPLPRIVGKRDDGGVEGLPVSKRIRPRAVAPFDSIRVTPGTSEPSTTTSIDANSDPDGDCASTK
jgi:hypothetical protein